MAAMCKEEIFQREDTQREDYYYENKSWPKKPQSFGYSSRIPMRCRAQER